MESLKNLLKGIDAEVKGSKEIEIRVVSANSKSVGPGCLFIAKKSKYIPEAIQGGAAAIVTDLYDPFLENVVQVITPDIEKAEISIGQAFYDAPAEKLKLIGITGTNGKTTTSYLIKHLLDPCGLVGTIEWIAGSKVFPSTHTTPDYLTNLKLFHEMIAQGCTSCVMEVSSHALSQGRVRDIPFDTAIFTNLTQDHLDYHQTMHEYAQAKAVLFSMLSSDATAIYNIDDPAHEIMLFSCKARKISYGLSPKAELYADNITLSAESTRFDVAYQGRKVSIATPLIGRFNVYNLLASIAAGLSASIPLEEMAEKLKTFSRVPGRLERVLNPKGLHIFVDYAHTDDALKNVLETLNEFKSGRLITVFGCGGNRDRAKRPKMAAVAEAMSDFVIVTTDNPRQEDPEEIIREITAGFQNKSRYTIDLNRSAAIAKAIQMATSKDIVLIAGKGHETYQIFSEKTITFDDRQVALEATL